MYYKENTRVVVLFLAVVTFIATVLFTPKTFAKEGALILESERYFPDSIGFQWTYSGSVAEQVQRVSDYTNTAIVKGKTKKMGVPVVVVWESNQSNRGQAESYLARDKEGIMYYGSSPTTNFEIQMIPFRAIQFPIVIGKKYLQIEKKNLIYDMDIDHDGVKEKANVLSDVTALAIETVSTPAGIFKNAIKFQGTMTVWVTLSGNKKRVPIIGTTTHWFAKDVGLVKQIEMIDFPEGLDSPPTGTITTEVLTEYTKPKSPA